MNENIFEVYPIGTVVKYVGGDEISGEVLTVGKEYTITEHDDLGFMGKVVGFEYGELDHGVEQCYPLSYGSFMMPNTAQYFEIVR